MITDGILSKGTRNERNWRDTKFNIPYSNVVDRFRKEVEIRSGFDLSTLLIYV